MSARSSLALRPVAVAGLLITLGACSSDTSGPSGQVLVGTWGSPDAEFIAIQAGAEVRAGCSSIVIHAPVGLTETNTFTARGDLHGSGAAIGKLPSVTVTGTVHGTRLVLVAPNVAGGPAVTYQLEAGVTRPAAEVPECPL